MSNMGEFVAFLADNSVLDQTAVKNPYSIAQEATEYLISYKIQAIH